MAEPTMADLVRLAAMEVSNPEDRIEKLFGWHLERTVASARGALGAAFSAIIAVVLAVISGEFDAPLISIVVFIVAAGFAIGSAIIYSWREFRRVRDIESVFVASLETFTLLRPFASRLYPYL